MKTKLSDLKMYVDTKTIGDFVSKKKRKSKITQKQIFDF